MKYAYIFLKLLLFIPVSYLLFREINFAGITTALLHANVALLIIASFFYLLKYTVQGLRWANAAQAHGVQGTLLFFIRNQLQIAFLEMIFFFPDSEDALRILKLRAISADGAKNMAIVLFDRITGTLFVLLLIPISGLWLADMVFKYNTVSYTLVAVLSILLVGVGLSYRKIISFTLQTFPSLANIHHRFFENLKQSMDMDISVARRACACVAVIAYALSGTLCVWLLVFSLGGTVPFTMLFLCVPLFYISQTLPLSYQGLGLYETTLVFILQQTGLPKDIALAAGTLHFVFHIIIIFMGGALFASGPANIRLAEIGGAYASGLKKINGYFFRPPK